MDVLKKSCTIQIKTPVPESLLMRFQSATLLKSVYIAKCSRKLFSIEPFLATVSYVHKDALENVFPTSSFMLLILIKIFDKKLFE